jgi:hypothetical protein
MNHLLPAHQQFAGACLLKLDPDPLPVQQFCRAAPHIPRGQPVASMNFTVDVASSVVRTRNFRRSQIAPLSFEGSSGRTARTDGFAGVLKVSITAAGVTHDKSYARRCGYELTSKSYLSLRNATVSSFGDSP